jgi:hypothetical protein
MDCALCLICFLNSGALRLSLRISYAFVIIGALNALFFGIMLF